MVLKGKTALVTGGSRGIGKAIALAMAKSGADVALNYVSSEQNAKETQSLILNENVRCEIYRFDVSDFSVSKKMTETITKDFGRVDILVNNAGVTRDGLVASMSEADFDCVLNTNLKGAFHMVKHLYSNFIRSRSGTIINIASISGLMGTAGQANYAAAKAGLIGFTKSVARELGGRNVTCNAIAPGFIESDMTAVLPEEIKQKYLGMIPLKRFGSVEDVASVAVFLATAGYITGEIIKIDGGIYI